MAPPRAHHVGVTVADLDDVLLFYRDALGFDVLDRFTVAGEAFATAVDVPEASGRFVHLDAGDIRLELVEYDPAGESVPEPSLDRPGATHLALAVDDLAAVYADLPDDVPTLSEPQTTASGSRICFLRDPEANLVELIET